MRITALIGAGLLGLATLTAPAPAEAQWRGGRHGGWHGDDPRYAHGYDRGDRLREGRRWRGSRYVRGHRPYRLRDRVVCRIRPGYRGPVRICRPVRR